MRFSSASGLDLVDDHLAHLRGALGGLLRHFQHAARSSLRVASSSLCISDAICFMLATMSRTFPRTA
jgi:hypothetical protein